MKRQKKVTFCPQAWYPESSFHWPEVTGRRRTDRVWPENTKREQFNEWMWTDRNERLHVKVYLSHLRWASLHRQLSMGGRHQMTANTHTRITAQTNTSLSTKLNKQIMFVMTSVSVRDVCTTESWGSSPDVWAAGHSPTEEESHHIWTTIRKILINMLIW